MTTLWWLVSSAWASAHLDVVVPDQWIAGHRVLLSVRYQNAGTAPTAVPDLTNRPWLVVFQTVDPSGIKRTVHSTAPANDPGTKIQLQSGESRITSFEVPVSESWATGKAEITVSVNGTDGGSHPIHVAADSAVSHRHSARPIDQTTGASTTVLSLPSDGTTHLFIQTRQRLQHIGRAAGHIEAQASIVRTGQRRNQWVTWTDNQGDFWATQSAPHATQSAPRRIAFPWPKSHACGPAATASSGHLVVPVCIPSPSGTVTKTVAAVVSPSGSMTFRTIAGYGPREILANVDASGGVEFVLIRDTAIDWAWLSADTAVDRPTSIKKVWRGTTLHSATLILTDDDPPSPAIRVRTAETDPPIVLQSPR